jgi:transposase
MGRAAGREKETKLESLDVIKRNACGIDIGARSHWVSVPPAQDAQPVRAFGCYAPDLAALVTWLQEYRIETVAMESTGVYWIPVFQMLEAAGFEVILVNAHHVKSVPGRKSDVLDCQWLRQLHRYGFRQSKSNYGYCSQAGADFLSDVDDSPELS